MKEDNKENGPKMKENKELKKDLVDDDATMRKTSRNMLFAAIKGDGTLLQLFPELDFETIASDVEEAIFKVNKQVNSKYKNQIRSRVFNLKTNSVLRESLVLGNINP